MGKRQGSLLERTVASVFRAAGFFVTTNTKIKGYEVDVLAQRRSVKIIVECKQYEKSRITIRNLVHEWYSKNDEIKADVVVIAIYGQEASEKDKELARKKRIILWDTKDIEQFMQWLTLGNLGKKKILGKIIHDLQITGNRNVIGDAFGAVQKRSVQTRRFVSKRLPRRVRKISRTRWKNFRSKRRTPQNRNLLIFIAIIIITAIVIYLVTGSPPPESAAEKAAREINAVVWPP